MRLSLSLCVLIAAAGCNGRPLVTTDSTDTRHDAGAVFVHADGATDATTSSPHDAAAPMTVDATSAAVTPTDAAVTPTDAAIDLVILPRTDAAADVGGFTEAGAAETGSASDAGACGTDALPCAVPPSCAGAEGLGLSSCGPDHDSCCKSLLVPGGTFYRSYDGVSCPDANHEKHPIPFLGCYLEKNAPATVSSFRLDKYLVTRGRFRRFVDAVVAGWTPPAGSGRHAHVNGGTGVADLGAPGSFEAGWDPAWTADLPRTRDDWNAEPGSEQWSSSPGADEDVPVGGVSWGEAYAFCIWDGGFLPTEAEWNYAAAGGDQQRVYPWSQPPSSTVVDCAHAAFSWSDTCQPDGPQNVPQPVGSRSPTGDGRWGQTDLEGNMDQWMLDWLRDYVTPSVDGAQLQAALPSDIVGAPMRAQRGNEQHGWADSPPFLIVGRSADTQTGVYSSDYGVRCARSP